LIRLSSFPFFLCKLNKTSKNTVGNSVYYVIEHKLSSLFRIPMC
jgi:hypothetical protein